ncbi:MAG: tetrahydrofolate dehydrogenase/cyclohydrolase catalytic domain-containing protein, partial [Deltaproteobacteria bacterium]
MAIIIDGKAISEKIRSEVKVATEKLIKEKGVTPGLAVVLVGDNPASKVYVGSKEKACVEMGFYSEKHVL